MITADHKKWAELIFNPYIKRLLKKEFSHFYVINSAADEIQNRNIIYTPNHFSWWDGFFIYYLNDLLVHKKFYIMMLEEQLRHYWFFKKVGAFGINPGNKKNIIQVKKYFNKVMSGSNNLMVMYTQGEIEPFDKRPLQIQKGLRFFINDLSSDSVVQPVAFKIQYQEVKKPSVFCRYGETVTKETICNNYDAYKKAFSENIEQLNANIFAKQTFTDLFA